jgi:hypothetical protein
MASDTTISEVQKPDTHGFWMGGLWTFSILDDTSIKKWNANLALISGKIYCNVTMSGFCWDLV